MRIVGVDEERCISCGACLRACPANLFSFSDDGGGKADIPHYGDHHHRCIRCGHCVSCCPADAVVWEAAEETPGQAREWPKAVRGSSIGYDSLQRFLRSKRSVRNYSEQTVPAGEIEAVVQAMRYAPTGHNMQAANYVIVMDRGKIRRMIEETAKVMNGFRKLIRIKCLLKPFLPQSVNRMLQDEGLENGILDLVARCSNGEDPIFHSAPVVILVTYPAVGVLSLIDPAIAFTYGMLAAHARGLGTCWIGYAITALRKNRKIKELFDIPYERIIAGVMTLGYPVVNYRKLPPRRDPEVSWFTS